MSDETRRAQRRAAMDAYLEANPDEPVDAADPATPPPGWYPFNQMVNTVRYWDGARWTEHYGPAPVADKPLETPTPAAAASARPAKADGVPCPYCGERLAAQATRCPHCSGQRMHCARCKALRGVRERQKFVGMARGGKQTVHDCLVCGKQLSGPRM